MRINDAYVLTRFFVFGEHLVGSLINGVNNNSPLQMIRRKESGRKNTRTREGYDGTNM